MLRVALLLISLLTASESAVVRPPVAGPELLYQLTRFVQWPIDRGFWERGTAERATGERATGERGYAERGPAEPGLRQRGFGERGFGERGFGQRGTGEQGAAEPFLVGLVGFDPMFAGLRAGMDGRILRGRTVVVRPAANPHEMRRCHVLFVGVSERARVREILAVLHGARVLTVSAIPGFGQMGGMVEILATDSLRRPLELNPAAVKRSGLMLSPSLFTVVRLTRSEDAAE
jgi:hypothetical protein